MKRAEQIAVGLHARVLCLAHYGRPMHGVEWRESGVDGYGPSFVAVWRSSACVLLIQTICCVSCSSLRSASADEKIDLLRIPKIHFDSYILTNAVCVDHAEGGARGRLRNPAGQPLDSA